MFLRRRKSDFLPSYFHSSAPSLEQLRQILSLLPSLRSPEQIKTLVTFSQHLKFFEELRERLSEAAHFQCCQHMSYQYNSAGQFLFHEGDQGNCFYVLLAGSCAVLRSSALGQKDSEQLTIVRQGEGVGELALLSKKPRAASVLCREDCHFAVLSREDYTRILARVHEELLQDKVTLLSLHPVFAQWTNNALRRFSYLFKVRILRRKQQLFQAGQLVTEVYVVKTGDFHLERVVLAQRGKHYSVEVSAVSAGEVLGAEDLLQSRVHVYTCVCASSVAHVLAIPKEDFTKGLGEESLNYFLSLGKTKEQYRSARLVAALRIQKERRAAVPSPQPKYTCPALRSQLLSERINTLQLRPTHNHTLSWPLSPREPCHVHSPSWCDVYSPQQHTHLYGLRKQRLLPSFSLCD